MAPQARQLDPGNWTIWANAHDRSGWWNVSSAAAARKLRRAQKCLWASTAVESSSGHVPEGSRCSLVGPAQHTLRGVQGDPLYWPLGLAS